MAIKEPKGGPKFPSALDVRGSTMDADSKISNGGGGLKDCKTPGKTTFPRMGEQMSGFGGEATEKSVSMPSVSEQRKQAKIG